MSSTRKIDVFVSYSGKDRERVRPIVATLQEQGLDVWWDTRIAPGAGFDTEIQSALDAASAVLVVWSEHSVVSEWVITEASEGLERGILVPVVIDDVKPPLAFRRRQTIDLHKTEATLDIVAAITATLSGAEVEFQRPVVDRKASRWPTLLTGVVGLLVGALAAALWPDPNHADPAAPETRVPLNLDGWAMPTVYPTPSFALASDGLSVVYVDASAAMLRIRQLDTLESRLLKETEGASNPFFSPDGRWVGYFVPGALFRVPVDGGRPSLIARIVGHDPYGGTWTQDDTIVWGSIRSGLRQTRVSDGEVSELTTLSQSEEAHRTPHAVLDSNYILFENYPTNIVAVNIATGERHDVIAGVYPSVVGAHRLIFGRSDSIWTVAFDPTSATALGTAEVIQTGVDSGGGAYAASEHSIVYIAGQHQGRASLTIVDGDKTILLDEGIYTTPRFSNEGTDLAVARYSSKGTEVFTFDLSNGARKLFAQDAWLPVWAQDDQAIVFSRLGTGLVRKDRNTGEETIMVAHDAFAFSSQWTRDGSFLFNTMNPETSSDLFMMSPGGETVALEQDAREHWAISVSENGEIATMVLDGMIIASRFPSIVPIWTIGEGIHPRWAGNDRVYFTNRGQIMASDVSMGATVQFSQPYAVMPIRRRRGIDPHLDVADDGRLAVISYDAAIGSRPIILSNWADDA